MSRLPVYGRANDDRNPVADQIAKEFSISVHATLSPPTECQKAGVLDSTDGGRNWGA